MTQPTGTLSKRARGCPSWTLIGCLLMLPLLGIVSGCTRPAIEAEYGRRLGKTAGRSVNGTGVLARMFEHQGSRVRTTKRIGRTVDSADTVVWIPDRYRPPGDAARDYLEEWLNDTSGRTLIYVGRDFDATVDYWEQSLAASPPEEQLETRRRLARRKADVASGRSGFENEEDCDWFALNRQAAVRKVESLEGPWSRGIDVEGLDMFIATRILPSEEIDDEDAGHGIHGKPAFNATLSSEDDVLVAEYTRSNWGSSRILIVANGSWLLNLPLVNHEHRKLALRLVQECNQPKRVVFLESGPGEPSVIANAPNQHHGLTAFTVWPVNCILIHLCLLGTILCFSVFPIFGRPHELPEEERSDFGKHIDALGQLMHRTADREYAKSRRDYYLQRVAGDARSRSDAPGTEPLPASPQSTNPNSDSTSAVPSTSPPSSDPSQAPSSNPATKK